MPDYSDDSDEELGAYIYRTSHTAQLLREKTAARNNELTTNNDANITRPKRKSPREVENNMYSHLTTNNDNNNITRPKRKIPNDFSVSPGSKRRMKKKRKKFTCSYEGCTNQVQKSAVCIRHGAKVKTCSQEGCTNLARKGGVCVRHGAKTYCSHEGCTKQVQKGGVCIRHGASWTKKYCSYEGCTNQVQRGGVCIRHGASLPKYTCSHEGCTNNAQTGGVCRRHSAMVKTCNYEGCTYNSLKGGVCFRHGASLKKYICAAMKDAPIWQGRGEFVSYQAQCNTDKKDLQL